MEQKQIIISISREYASSGHSIAKKLAEKFGIEYFDRNLLEEIAAEQGFDIERMKKFDEVPRHMLFSRTVNGMSNSPEEVVANIQFDYIRKKAAEGTSFVVVGRCADEVLQEYQVIKLFIMADEKEKIAKVSKERGVNEDEARGIIQRHDKKRKAYHNYFCQKKWGEASSYDLTINASSLGIEKTTELIAEFVRMRT